MINPIRKTQPGHAKPSRRDFLRSPCRNFVLRECIRSGSRAAVAVRRRILLWRFRPPQSGITWVHTAGKSAEHYLPETTGAGCAFLDYDNDGWMDIYLVNSGKCDFFDPNPPLRNALYRNNRDGTFTDVTAKAGVGGGGYGQGVAVGDYDGDGFPDIYVTQYGAQHSLSQQRRRHFYRCHGKGRGSCAGMVLQRGLV